MTDTPLSSPADARSIRIDAEHFSVRFWVPVLAIVLTAAIHFTGMSLLGQAFGDSTDPACIMLPADFVILITLAFVIERALKRLMPSRRTAHLSNETLRITDARHDPPRHFELHWNKTLNVIAWRFRVRRRTRVPKGWYCMALQLLQDEQDAILYTFMPQEEAEAVSGYAQFVRLRPRKETESNTDLSAVAEQRRLLKLEDARWEDGAEISRDDFRALLARIEQHVPGWNRG